MGDRDGLADRAAEQLAEGFEGHRSHLRAVAYRMLGSLSEADDAVQEAWLRASRAGTGDVRNLGGWLTTIVARVCLNVLRTRRSRREEPLGPQEAGLSGERRGRADPELEAVQADQVGLALLVVLDRLSPAERVAFVLHDLFALPFDQIAPIVERTPTATKKLASRARQRVRGATRPPAADLDHQRKVVDAFLDATRRGDLDALLAVLAPDVLRRVDPVALPAGTPVLRGAQAVAEETRTNIKRARVARPALVDGAVGLIVAPGGRLFVAIRLTIEDDRVTKIEVVGDPQRLSQLDLGVLDI